MNLDPRLLEILACPSCHLPLVEGDSCLTCANCAVSYPVREGIPVLLIDEAVPLQA